MDHYEELISKVYEIVQAYFWPVLEKGTSQNEMLVDRPVNIVVWWLDARTLTLIKNEAERESAFPGKNVTLLLPI